MPSRPSTRPSDAKGRRSSAFVREDSGTATGPALLGAAPRGSPLSGGYAGAKAAIRFITGYAADESSRTALGITFRCVLPQSAAVAAYAARQGAQLSPTT